MQRIKQDAALGNNIREMRRAAGMTQEQVAAKLQLAGCDMSRSVYSQIECGTHGIRANELVALKKLFGVEYGAFFEGMDA